MTEEIITQEPIVEIAPLIEDVTPTPAAPTTETETVPEAKVEAPTEKEARDDSVMWVAYREPNMQKRMKYLTHRLTQGLTTKLHAYGLAIGTAVWMSTSIRQQLSGVEQKASMMELKDEAKQRESFGIEIVLSVTSGAAEWKREFTPNQPRVKRSPKGAETLVYKKKQTSETSDSTEQTTTEPVKPEIKVKVPEVADKAVVVTAEKENQTNNTRPRKQKSVSKEESDQKPHRHSHSKGKQPSEGKFYDDGAQEERRRPLTSFRQQQQYPRANFHPSYHQQQPKPYYQSDSYWGGYGKPQYYQRPMMKSYGFHQGQQQYYGTRENGPSYSQGSTSYSGPPANKYQTEEHQRQLKRWNQSSLYE